MKKVFLSIAAASLLLASCQDAPNADTATATDAQSVAEAGAAAATYKADVAQTKVEFVGTKPTGKHHGTIGVKDGSLAVENDMIKGGQFVMDMNTMKTDDQDSTGNAKLTGHLASPDFFDIAQFSTATFDITTVASGVDSSLSKDLVMKDATHTITGNLTLKGVSKSITIPAKVNINDANITADANFNIDRTQWGLVYGADKSIRDKFIDPIVNISLHLVANK